MQLKKVSIVIPTEMDEQIRKLIKARYGNAHVRAFSLVIREALNQYLRKEGVGNETKS